MVILFIKKQSWKAYASIIFAAIFFTINFQASSAAHGTKGLQTPYIKITSDTANTKTINISSGTGFFVSEDSIITNEHVVQNCAKIKIRGAVPKSYATLVSADKKNDLALLHTDATPPGIAALRDGAPVENGESVNVMGYPLERGLKGSYLIKKAVITNNLDVYDGVERLQFTDSVERGNSGGPLLDTSGTVIGVIVGKLSFYQTGADMQVTPPIKVSGVAITLNKLKKFLNENNIFFRTDSTNYRYTDSYMEDKAKDYIVNVQCIKTDE